MTNFTQLFQSYTDFQPLLIGNLATEVFKLNITIIWKHLTASKLNSWVSISFNDLTILCAHIIQEKHNILSLEMLCLVIFQVSNVTWIPIELLVLCMCPNVFEITKRCEHQEVSLAVYTRCFQTIIKVNWISTSVHLSLIVLSNKNCNIFWM